MGLQRLTGWGICGRRRCLLCKSRGRTWNDNPLWRLATIVLRCLQRSLANGERLGRPSSDLPALPFAEPSEFIRKFVLGREPCDNEAIPVNGSGLSYRMAAYFDKNRDPMLPV